jgi:ribosome recycling factor
MYKEIIKEINPYLDKTLEYLKTELLSMQVGRATPALVENLEVECYNSRFPLKQLATILAPEPRQILIQPWDKDILKDIEKAILNSRLHLSPTSDGDIIRLTIPPLSEERRRELVKILKEKTEECRVSIRRYREEVWKKIQNLEKDSKISEDDKFKAKDDLQELVDQYNKKVEELSSKKEEEIMKV